MTSPNTPTAAAPGGKRNKAIPVLALLGLAALAWGGKTYVYNRHHVTTDNAQVDGTIIPVLAKVGGYVNAVRVAENQVVKGGDLLVQIDSSEYEVKVAQTEADLAAAAAAAGGRGVAGQAEAMVQNAESQQSVIAAQIQSARSAKAKALADLARMAELVGKQIVSRQQLDAAQATADQATSALTAIEQQAGAATAQLSGARAGEKLAQARFASASAARANARLQLGYTRVTAPIGGTVSRKQVEIGQLVESGQPLLTIVADTSVFITANFKETQLADIKLGYTAAIEVDTYPGCDAEGKVESVSAATGAKFALLPPDNSTGNFTKVVQRVPVRIQVTKGCGDGRPLRPGMSVTVRIATS